MSNFLEQNKNETAILVCVKFRFSKKSPSLISKSKSNWEISPTFSGLLRKSELYVLNMTLMSLATPDPTAQHDL